jgi:hypothetical protein
VTINVMVMTVTLRTVGFQGSSVPGRSGPPLVYDRATSTRAIVKR